MTDRPQIPSSDELDIIKETTMLTRIRAWYAGLSNPVKAALATAAATFAAVFGTALVGWTNDVLTWISDLGTTSGSAVPFPDPSVLTKAAVAGVTASATGLVNYVYRKAQAAGWLPGSGPTYPAEPPT